MKLLLSLGTPWMYSLSIKVEKTRFILQNHRIFCSGT